jgi:ParB-like chromosome segregation protein Spo0J
MKIEKMKISDLVFDSTNARKHSIKNLEAIKGSLHRWGQQKPIVVDAKNVIIAGNGTAMAAKDLGWSEIQCYRTKLEGYEAMAFAISDNRTAELADWDFDILKESINALELNGLDIDFLDFSLTDLVTSDTKNSSKELSENDFNEFDHKCPKCGFEFDNE